MSNICKVCEKRPQVVNNVSNANNRTKRWVYPNVHTIRYSLRGQSEVYRGAICTKCVKAGLVVKIV